MELPMATLNNSEYTHPKPHQDDLEAEAAVKTSLKLQFFTTEILVQFLTTCT